VFGATPSEDWLTRVTGNELADVARNAIAAARGRPTLDEAASTPPATRLQLPLWSWALNRARSGLVPSAAPVEANVAICWTRIAPGSPAATKIGGWIDIVANRTLTDGDFKRGVAQGVLDTVIEHEIASPGAPGGNTAALYGLGDGSGWQLIEPQQVDRVALLALSEDAKARLKSDLAAGNLVLAPSAPVPTEGGPQVAWWRIDPRSGATLGIGRNGMGNAEVEDAWTLKWIAAKAACAFLGVGLQIGFNEFSITSTTLIFFCFAAPTVHSAIPLMLMHGAVDMVVDIFANAMTPNPREPSEPPEPPEPPVCREPPPQCSPDDPQGC
jgi:hypothetical protein